MKAAHSINIQNEKSILLHITYMTKSWSHWPFYCNCALKKFTLWGVWKRIKKELQSFINFWLSVIWTNSWIEFVAKMKEFKCLFTVHNGTLGVQKLTKKNFVEVHLGFRLIFILNHPGIQQRKFFFQCWIIFFFVNYFPLKFFIISSFSLITTQHSSTVSYAFILLN